MTHIISSGTPVRGAVLVVLKGALTEVGSTGGIYSVVPRAVRQSLPIAVVHGELQPMTRALTKNRLQRLVVRRCTRLRDQQVTGADADRRIDRIDTDELVVVVGR